MDKLGSLSDLQERLALAERAIAEASARISELTRALGEMANAANGEELSEPKPIVIGADSVSPFCIGFYQREYDPTDRAYRWTGRGKLFELRFAANRNFAWDFSMALQRNAHVDLSRLVGFVDYLEIPLTIQVSEGLVRGVVPPRPFGRQVVLTFLLPSLFVPNQINPDSPDTRSLGLVFYEFRAVPTLLASDMTEAGPPENRTEPGRESLLRKARVSLSHGAGRPKKLF